MLDTHSIPTSDWGIKPILFSFHNIDIYSYPLILSIGLIVSATIYYFQVKKIKKDNENSFFIALAAIFGGIIGAKLFTLLSGLNTQEIWQTNILYSGKSIIGGLVGGTIAVIITKKKLGITEKRGNLFVFPIIVGMIIGRIGCFLRGCCYGSETHLPWGTDFGDHVYRHPTQIYEIVFWSILLVFTLTFRKKFTKPGSLFQLTIASYFIFRFFLEFIKEEPSTVFNLTIFQIALPLLLINMFRSQLIAVLKKISRKIKRLRHQ